MSGFKIGLAFAITALIALALSRAADVRNDRNALMFGAAGLAVVALAVWLDTHPVGPLRPLFNLSALFPLGIGVLFVTRLVAGTATGAVSLFFLAAALVLVPLGFVLAIGHLVEGHG